MRILLDTHVFLWFISGDPRLPTRFRSVIESLENDVFLSSVSVWECIVKSELGKLPLPEPAATYVPRQRERHLIRSLALDEASARRLADLPPLHRDPFDRMLICQALEYGLSMATVDDAIRGYPVPIA